MREITLAITGASGAPYAHRLLQVLLNMEFHVHLLISKAALMVAAVEQGQSWPANHDKLADFIRASISDKGKLSLYGRDDWMSPVASGSGAPSTMIICPCSTGTLASIATGQCDNLIERGADVVLKEQGKLILVPRETPLSEIHLENMLKLKRAGAVILPASPGFYHQPEQIADLIDFVVARILKSAGFEQTLLAEWGR
ncbi:flavin prenyltransferase UbiX [Reinekea marinisedimentorum]|uniref:Flavin prenyltransferase UbiX n=1 Tax=Reinekea marinisedimentorum TaxID=230495 RepID=A0A4R3I032_9GAMM|nr:flavin prenyltransferase UbiX [Reinekea marinisedimentorum]TCS37149.1 4-hydroxy-3-polyprenylbenzoate decarboxylase [Reinekea marinisedimentorum]